MGSEIAHMSYNERQERHARHWAYADQLLDMFTRGESYRKMQAATGVPIATIHKIVHAAAGEYVEHRYGDRTTVLGRELAILDSLTRSNLRAAQNGDEKAARIVLESRRSVRRLLGLDAAIRAEVTVKTAQDIEIERLVSLMKQDPADDQTPDRAEAFLKL
jgi:hypothetical protein